ncbi:histidine phosphatase family protein [Blautia liquoris]|uniref:phosphoglycerate mutase (2,3-diphosphoglycerate-dependent) n=1 Tax=Blautia liquoris TaxID=2779518 RepID=A0A7M2RM35_9FIRM|nr:histidine phosphatase family protein [Blautia liquoris]QOV20607.1 histidine phosphatase family protein [Blautia liquoris]
MRLYIIRHGETDWNVQGRLQGQSDTQLNENGIRLAKITAKALKDIPFDLGFSSPSSRALKTAKIILGDRNVPILTDNRLLELSFGAWEGLGCHKDNFEIPSDHFDDFYLRPMQFIPGNGGETIPELCERTSKFYTELIHNPDYQDKTILIATHGCTVRALLQNVKEDREHFWGNGVPMNCAVNIVSVENGVSTLRAADQVYYGEDDMTNYYTLES